MDILFRDGWLGEGRGEEEGGDFFGEVVRGYFGTGPFIIMAITDDKFNFIARVEGGDIAPIVAIDFSTAGGFEIDDADNSRVTRGDITGPTGFEEDSFTEGAELRQEGMNFILEKWFAAGEFHEVAGVGVDLAEEFFL